MELDLGGQPWPVFPVAASATSYPFLYADDEWTDLGALAVQQQHEEPTGRLHAWARGFVRSDPTDTLALLKDLNAGILEWISYQSRDDEGTQTPLQTLDRGWGSMSLSSSRAVRPPPWIAPSRGSAKKPPPSRANSPDKSIWRKTVPLSRSPELTR